MLRLALLDWDNSLRRGYTVADWTQFLVERGLVAPWDAEGVLTVFRRYRRGEISYETLASESARAYASALQGLSESDVRTIARDFVARDEALMRFTRRLLRDLRALVRVVVVSGCPDEVLSVYAQALAIDEAHGLRLTTESGRFIGTVAKNPALTKMKSEITETRTQGARAVLGMGDSDSDLPLLRAAALQVVVDNRRLAQQLPRSRYIESDAPVDAVVDPILMDVRAVLEVRL